MEGTCNECVFPRTEEESKLFCSTDTSVIFAVRIGKLSCVKELIAAGADVNAACESHSTGALMPAAIVGRTDCLEELIKDGVDVNLQDKDGCTSLIFASEYGKINCIKKLLKAGAKLNVKEDNGGTALMSAIRCQHADCTSELIAAGADVNIVDKNKDTALIFPALKGTVDLVTKLISAGADVNIRNNAGNTALMCAVEEGHFDCVKELIKANADMNIENLNKITALFIAALKGHTECLKELIDAHAQIDKHNEKGLTALIAAAKEGHVDCVKELLKAGANVNATDTEIRGDTALMRAVAAGHVECVKELISSKADLNTLNKQRSTPLAYAVQSSNVIITDMLLSAGAKIDQSPNFMQELRADNNEQIECLKLLLEAGADLNAIDEEENTPLIKAVVRGNEGIIKILLKEKSDINAQNQFGETALYKAVMLGHAETERKHSMEEFADIREDKFFSTYETIVYELLQAGATLDDTSLDHNPCTAHLTPNQFSKPSRHILEMLSAAGTNTVETEMIKSDQSLQYLVRGMYKNKLETNSSRIQPLFHYSTSGSSTSVAVILTFYYITKYLHKFEHRGKGTLVENI